MPQPGQGMPVISLKGQAANPRKLIIFSVCRIDAKWQRERPSKHERDMNEMFFGSRYSFIKAVLFSEKFVYLILLNSISHNIQSENGKDNTQYMKICRNRFAESSLYFHNRLCLDVLIVNMINAACDNGQQEPFPEAVFFLFKKIIYCIHFSCLPEEIINAACYDRQDDVESNA